MLLIGFWTSFVVLNYEVVEWVDIFANPVFKNPGISSLTEMSISLLLNLVRLELRSASESIQPV